MSDNETEMYEVPTDTSQVPAEDASSERPKGLPDDATCGRCGRAWGKQGGLQCTACNLWVHKKCTKLPTALFNTMNDYYNKGENHYWACNSCSIVVKKLQDNIVTITKRLEVAESKIQVVDDVNSRVNALSADVVANSQGLDEMYAKIASLENELKELRHKSSDSNKAQILTEVFDEIEDKERRANNLIFHNVPENSPSNSKKDNFDYEIDQVGLYCEAMNVEFKNRDDVKFIYRAGERQQNGRSRPLVVGMRDNALKEYILRVSYRLKNTRFPEVRIIPDITKMQRDRESDLYHECEARNANRTPDETNRFLWRVLGRRGCKRLVRGAPEEGEVIHLSEPNNTPISQVSAELPPANRPPPLLQTPSLSQPTHQQMQATFSQNTQQIQTTQRFSNASRYQGPQELTTQPPPTGVQTRNSQRISNATIQPHHRGGGYGGRGRGNREGPYDRKRGRAEGSGNSPPSKTRGRGLERPRSSYSNY